MNDVTRAIGSSWCLVVVLAGCAGIRDRAEPVDPDLQPLVSEVSPAEVETPPDEVIGPPDAPGADLVGEDPPANPGPTRHVSLDDEPAGNDKVVAQPKREKLPSLMGDILWGPRDN